MHLEWNASCVLESARSREATAVNKREARGERLERDTITHGPYVTSRAGEICLPRGVSAASWPAETACFNLGHGLWLAHGHQRRGERKRHSTC